jgi:hypothetical protein
VGSNAGFSFSIPVALIGGSARDDINFAHILVLIVLSFFFF